MEYEELCMCCMKDKGEETVCPFCGFDEENEERNYGVLPMRIELDGRYIIGKVLGDSGGFGITYLAFDINLQKKVAIKEYFPHGLVTRDYSQGTVMPNHSGDSENFSKGMEDFVREAQTLARFNNPNIVKVYNFFYDNDTAYMVMEYYEGVDLKEYIARKGGKISEEEACNIMLPIMEGLKEVHAKNFLHRDIKPANIYMTKEGVSVLLDFGSARLSQADKSKSIVLTPGFAPIEQYARNGKQGPWTDVYGVATTFYNIVTGMEAPEASERIIEDKTVYLENIDGKFSPNFCKAIRKGMEVVGKDRFQTVKEFEEALTVGRKKSKTANSSAKKKQNAIPKKFILLGVIVAVILIASLYTYFTVKSYGTILVSSKTAGKILIDGIEKSFTTTGKAVKIKWVKNGNREISIVYDPKNSEKIVRHIKGGKAEKIEFKWLQGLEHMIPVGGGSFMMGGSFGGDFENEKPLHEVALKDFFVYERKVTVGEFKQFINETKYLTTAEKEGGAFVYTNGTWEQKNGATWKSLKKADTDSVVCVSWWDAIKFCNWKSQKEGVPVAYSEETGEIIDENGNPAIDITKIRGYRLPTEAEWEYIATDGGKKTTLDELNNSNEKNKYNITDAVLNGWEWCSDSLSNYKEEKQSNPYTFKSSDFMVQRGSWNSNKESTRSANTPKYCDSVLSFRVVLMR